MGAIGTAIAAPVLFIINLYKAARTADKYHFRGHYRLQKAYYYNAARTFGCLMLVMALVLGGLYKSL